MHGNKNTIIKYLLEQDNDKEFVLEEYKEKRSNNANSYFYVLVNKIADVLHKSKDEVHDDMLKQYGQVMTTSVLASIDMTGYYEYFDYLGTSVLNDKEFKHYKIYKPSHTMNSKEMSVLIDGVVQEATDLDIPTLDNAKINKLIESWDNGK